MKKINKINLYYFSGTGNTKLITDKMAEVFTENNVTTKLFKIENTDPAKIDLTAVIGLAFPVAMQSTFPFIWDFIRKMPPAKNTQIFMADTLHSFSGAIVGPLKKVLNKKGYKTIGAKEIIMPNNLYPQKNDTYKNNKKISEGIKSAENYALSILNNSSRWNRIPLISDLFYKLVKDGLIWNFSSNLGKKFEINRSKCTKCGICIKLCPVKNIKLENNAIENYPVYDNQCQQCLRCLNFCPEDAISIKFIWEYEKYRSVELNKML